MRTLNFYGTTSCFVPKLNTSLPLVEVNGTYTGNKIIFFKGTIPSVDTLYEIMSETALRATYSNDIICDISNIDLTYTQDNSRLKRTITKTADVLDLPYLKDGTVTWCAIVLREDVPTTNFSSLLFTDSIGTREQDDKFITLESLTGLAGGLNLLRDFSMILTEKSTMEI
jgi:hypothetical protein